MKKRKSKNQVYLTPNEKQKLKEFVASGQKKAREITRARILLLCDEGKKDHEIMALLNISRPPISKLRKKYAQYSEDEILDVIKEAPRSGRPIQIDNRIQSNITMIACSDPPEGSARWTLNMIADKVVEMSLIESICHESIRRVLKKTD